MIPIVKSERAEAKSPMKTNLSLSDSDCVNL